MGKAKKAGIAIGIIFTGFFIIAGIYGASRSVTEETKLGEEIAKQSSTNASRSVTEETKLGEEIAKQSSTNASRSVTEEIKPTPIVIRRPAYELLPDKRDLPLGWVSTRWEIVEAYHTGFLDGIIHEYIKGSGLNTATTIVKIYRFDTMEHAYAFYKPEVDYVKYIGGYRYEEIYIADNCFGAYSIQERYHVMGVYCVKGNVMFEVISRVDDEVHDIPTLGDVVGHARKFTKIVDEAIH